MSGALGPSDPIPRVQPNAQLQMQPHSRSLMFPSSLISRQHVPNQTPMQPRRSEGQMSSQSSSDEESDIYMSDA